MKIPKKLFMFTDKKGKVYFEHRKPSLREFISIMLLFLIKYLIYPFYYGWMGLRKLYEIMLYDKIRTGDNGVYGPGYHTYYTTKFSWGKLSFIVLIIFIIFFLASDINNSLSSLEISNP